MEYSKVGRGGAIFPFLVAAIISQISRQISAYNDARTNSPSPSRENNFEKRSIVSVGRMERFVVRNMLSRA